MPKNNLFRKMVLILSSLLLPIVGLYVVSNRIGTGVLRDELNDSNENRLAFFQHQADTMIQSVALWPNLLIHDPDIMELRHTFESPGPSLPLDMILLVKRIQRKLSIQESSSNWRSSLFIYSPTLGRVLSVNDAVPYDDAELRKRLKPGWQVQPVGDGRYRFSLFTVSPYASYDHPRDASLIIEVQFDSANIVQMLDKFKSDERRDPFYYKPGVGVIYNSTADRGKADRLVRLLERQGALGTGSRTVTLDGQSYLVNMQKSDITDWYLIDYIPLAEVVQPIERANRLFYVSVGSLLLMGCVMAYVLYAQVQAPLKQLVTSFQRLKHEDYAVRLKPKGNNEFSFVFLRFNSMVEQIQELFNRVYLERLHVKEARLKQLQSQINPHFFYNCISFISSMAKMKNHQAVIAMAENLSSYFRYATRQERDFVTLEEELQFVGSFLEIHKLRRSNLSFSVELPSRLRHLLVPPLIIQPLAENAVRHGIEANGGHGLIRIAVSEADGVYRVVVDDNGKGLDEDGRRQLMRRLAEPMDERTGCGLWNVNQRLQLRYGPDAGVRIEPSPLGGLRVVLEWRQAHRTTPAALAGRTDDGGGNVRMADDDADGWRAHDAGSVRPAESEAQVVRLAEGDAGIARPAGDGEGSGSPAGDGEAGGRRKAGDAGRSRLAASGGAERRERA